MNKIVKNTAILTVITLVAGILLGAVYEITKEPIQASKEKAKQEAYRSVLPGAEAFETYEEYDLQKAADVLKKYDIAGCSVDEAVVGKSEADETVGYVITTTSSEGYGGDITVSVGITMDGTVTGMELLTINETAGLGMKADEPEFKDQFKDQQNTLFTLKKNDPDGNVDALSGATITSNAVTNAVNAGVAYFHEVLGGSADE